MLSLDDLRFFSAVAGAKSLAATARALDVTPPAVSQRLAGLERKMGVRLIERQRNGVQLTEEGDLVAARARALLQDLDDLESEVAARRDELSGPLRVAAPLGFGRRYLGPLIARFHEAHPAVNIDLSLSDRPPDPNARVDIAVHIGELRESSAILVKLAPNERIICASPDYLARAGTPADAGELNRFDCLALRENDEDSTLWRFTHGEEHLSVRVRPRLASNDGEIIREWALEGRGIMIRSEWHVADDLRAGRLVQMLHDFKPPTANVVALLGPSRARLARTQRFLDHLKGELNPAPWRAAARSRA